MTKGFFNVPVPKNEPVKSYLPGSPERKELKAVLAELKNRKIDIPMFIGGNEVRSGVTATIPLPHDHRHIIGVYHKGDADHVNQAITSAMNAKEKWEDLPWEQRAAIFLKAADLIAGPYRAKMNAATMLGQSKNVHQAEIDAACEMIDFLRFNVSFMEQIYRQQPGSGPQSWNRLEQRPLEGFIFALTPFNFTSIAGNLPSSPAIMGNTVVWKPSRTAIYSANVLMEIFNEAGLPAGVINLILVDGPTAGDIIFSHPDFGGIHFTGGTTTFQRIWKTIGSNIAKYKTYPRIVGETGGKDFVMVHESADPKEISTALIRGAFEYQGQKCSAASRAYIPDTIWEQINAFMQADLADLKMGDVEDFSNFMNAVIDEKSFDDIVEYIENARNSNTVKIIAGGKYDKSKGFFIEPTVLLSEDPQYVTMVEEIFGPVLTIYVYQANRFEETLELVDQTSPYSLTGAIFAKDRYAIDLATRMLRNSAVNFYINDKPTGAVVGQQPFGGTRASGTNDKAGSMINLLRWVSPRTIKENFLPPKDYRYPFMSEK
ncbi:MAG: L-glutamate gamma-semialdehyde dehydrogenase [Cyclobacteriaceae bacterium]|nr:L-glutamate gamma-semialdehyde dehydrogenase [Cyclobacteriaceae bacterium]